MLNQTDPKRLGIFFYYQTANRLADFPARFDGILERDNVLLYDAVYEGEHGYLLELVAEPWLSRVHSQRMIETIRSTNHYLSALYSASGTVQATLKILAGELERAFIFTGFGDHHAGPDFYGGGCYFNGAAAAIAAARQETEAKRFAIIDTDAHQGTGGHIAVGSQINIIAEMACPCDY
jgi:acetoin utilization deacetylase AcuC-like enzyme